MPLPTMTDTKDVERWTTYLRTKPTGATVKETEGVLGKPATDGRKISGLVSWGIVQREGDKVALTADGRSFAMADEVGKAKIFGAIVLRHSPYMGTLEWAVHNNIDTVTSADVVARWLNYHKADVASDNETSLNRMAVCFFHLLEGAGIGALTIGRRGSPTRFDINLEAADELVNGHDTGLERVDEKPALLNADFTPPSVNYASNDEQSVGFGDAQVSTDINQVFVGHGRNQQILDQVKELLTYGRFEPVVAEEEETTAVPVPRKVLDALRRSQAGVINVSADEQVTDDKGHTRYTINQNVLTEIGAAFVLYDEKVVLLTDRRVELPSNLQGIYRCEYEGDTLDFEATMKLLKALNRFRE